MALTRKPKAPRPEADAVDIQALIERGGSVAGEESKGKGKGKDDPKKLIPVFVRVPAAMLERLDAAVEARDAPISRSGWIVEAVMEKLKREE